jgi:hypothetical protein
MEFEMKRMMFLIFVVLFAFVAAGWAQDEPVRTVPRTTEKVVLDGSLDDAAWAKALSFELKYETQPGDRVTPPQRTEVFITYDDKNIYVAFKCYDDNPDSIRAHITDREACLDDDHVNVHFDTFNDEKHSVMFGGNARGVQMDAIGDNYRFDWDWDSIWDSAGAIHDYGWALEMSIPFNQFRFQRTDGPQIWGFDAWRLYPRSDTHYIQVVPVDRDNNNYQSQMLKIEGFEGIEPGNNIEINPTLTGVVTQERDGYPDGDFETTNKNSDAGVSLQWGVTPNITLNATANPDFSQIEADSPQMDINTRFALQYQEKRPFFLEGAGMFRNGMLNTIYSRTMADPDWGAKVTGKEGKHSFGLLTVKDSLTNLLLPGVQSSRYASLTGSSQATAGRYKYDLNSNHMIGMTFTDRSSGDYFNRVVGLDGEFNLGEKDVVRAQYLMSSTDYSNGLASSYAQPEGQFSGNAFRVEHMHDTKHTYTMARMDKISPEFRADLGFIPQVGLTKYTGMAGYSWIPEEKTWYSHIRSDVSARYYTDDEGNALVKRADIFSAYHGPMQSFAAFRLFNSTESYMGEELNTTYFGTNTSFSPFQQLYAELDTSFGTTIDYANVRVGDRFRLNPTIVVRPNDHLKLALSHEYEHLDYEGDRVYTANISYASLVYQFNTRMFIRGILQYVNYDYEQEMYISPVEDKFETLFSQLLFSYKINPRTVLFLGYSDNYFGQDAISLSQTDRTLFFKIGYAWQM